MSGAGGLAVGKVRTAADLLETDWAKSADPTYTSLVGDHEIRLPKGPWLFNGKDSGALSAAAAPRTRRRARPCDHAGVAVRKHDFAAFGRAEHRRRDQTSQAEAAPELDDASRRVAL